MSIEDINKLDMIGIPKNNSHYVELGLTDHLSWDFPYESHLYKLQQKLNSYINIIETGNIYKYFPAAKGREKFLIKIYFKYQIPDECINFLQSVNEVVLTINTVVEYEIG